MKRSLIAVLGLSALAFTEASAQNNAPDALNYKEPRTLFYDRPAYYSNLDSVAKLFGGSRGDSIKVNANGSLSFSGTLPKGLLLDNRLEADCYIHNGTRYYIRNMKPLIDPKPVVQGSTIYNCM